MATGIIQVAGHGSNRDNFRYHRGDIIHHSYIGCIWWRFPKKEITIDQIVGLMPRCLTVGGTAPVEDGKVSWLAHRGDRSDAYFFAQTSREVGNEDRWFAKKTVGDGSAGERHHFFAFQLDERYSDFLNNVVGVGNDGSSGYFYAKSMFPGFKFEPQMVAESAPDPKRC